MPADLPELELSSQAVIQMEKINDSKHMCSVHDEDHCCVSALTVIGAILAEAWKLAQSQQKTSNMELGSSAGVLALSSSLHIEPQKDSTLMEVSLLMHLLYI